MSSSSEQNQSNGKSIFGGLFGSLSTAATGGQQKQPPPSSMPSPISDLPTMPDNSDAQSVSDFLSDMDTSKLSPMGDLAKGLEYLELDPAVVGFTQQRGPKSFLPSRQWTDDLCYGTGGTYLTGLTIGGTWGFFEGMQRARLLAQSSVVTPMQTATNMIKEGIAEGIATSTTEFRTKVSFRLRLNTVLNAMTRRGPFIGNSCGVVALMYNIIQSALGGIRGGKQDIFTSLAAGTLSGAIFKSSAGVRPMGTAALMGLSAAAAWNGAKYFILGPNDDSS